MKRSGTDLVSNINKGTKEYISKYITTLYMAFSIIESEILWLHIQLT